MRISRQYQQKHINTRVPASPAITEWFTNSQPHEAPPGYALYDLMRAKDTLNAEKSKLDVFYDLSKTDTTVARQVLEFHNIIDVYKPLRFTIEEKFNAKPVTNAWLKYWEIYSQYDLIPQKAQCTAFFNAELPGAALCALNHYMKTMRPTVDFDWRASSLAPRGMNDPDALGDTYGLYAKNLSKWLMNDHNNGDATSMSNLRDFAARVGPDSPFGGVDLYSHDAGIDVSNDFNNQELANAKIHLGCALAGFMTLKVGGAFIAKQYTYFETVTWNLILVYATMFEEFYLCKPLTSRPYNSEIYLIGKGFKGMPDAVANMLSTRLQEFHDAPLLPRDMLDGQTLDPMLRFARVMFGQQSSILSENIVLLNKYRTALGTLRKGLDAFKKDRAAHWFKCYPVPTIVVGDNLPSLIN